MSALNPSGKPKRTSLPLLLTGFVVAASLLSLGACSDRGKSRRVLPEAEFLFSAGDSTWWVRSGEEGMRVRSAPILLTQVGSQLFEIFLTDDGAEYSDASFATTRLWSRALGKNDSTLLFSDSTVTKELAAWRKRFPSEQEVDPFDDNVVDDPQTVVQDHIEVYDVHGPYLTFEHLLDVDIDGGPSHLHTGRRFVVDVRSGRVMSLGDLLGEAESARVIAEARTSMVQLLDSIRNASVSGDERAQAAVDMLDGFSFDSTSFGMSDLSREPAVAFMIPGNGPDGEAVALNLPPIAVKVAEPAWWKSVRETLPEWTADSSLVRWKRSGYVVSARLSDDGTALSLMLSSAKVIRTPKEWPVATVAVPAYQLISLDSPPLDEASRAALARAFDVSVALDGMAQRAELPSHDTRVDSGDRSVRYAVLSPRPSKTFRSLRSSRSLP